VSVLHTHLCSVYPHCFRFIPPLFVGQMTLVRSPFCNYLFCWIIHHASSFATGFHMFMLILSTCFQVTCPFLCTFCHRNPFQNVQGSGDFSVASIITRFLHRFGRSPATAPVEWKWRSLQQPRVTWRTGRTDMAPTLSNKKHGSKPCWLMIIVT